MEEETGYVDDKPFEKINKEEQQQSTIKIKENKIEICIINNKKYYLNFYSQIEALYAISSQASEITALRAIQRGGTLGSIVPICKFSSDFFFYNPVRKIHTPKKFMHFTEKTKIRKLSYYSDSVYKVFDNQGLQKKVKSDKLNNLEGVKCEAKKVKKIKLGEMNFDNNKIKIWLDSSWTCNSIFNDTGKMSLEDNSRIILEFQKGIYFQEAYDFVLLLDSLFYLMTFAKKRHKKILICDYKKNKYECIDPKIEKLDNQIKNTNFILGGRENSKVNFMELFKGLYKLSKDSKNAIFPFLEYDKEKTIGEIKFLEYYKVLEYIHVLKQKMRRKR